MLALGIVTTLWPAAEAISRRRWAWLLAILVLSPVAGIAWLAVGRRHPASPLNGCRVWREQLRAWSQRHPALQDLWACTALSDNRDMAGGAVRVDRRLAV